jgi:predicted nucleotidyltransferase component of viral defense system
MIPIAYIRKWRETVPWSSEGQVAQDLVLSRVLIELFSDPILGKELAFRGGTALYKLYLQPPLRYSEDLDFVRINAGPIGGVISNIREKLDHWLGNPSTKRNQGLFTLFYEFKVEELGTYPKKIKIEINTRELNSLFDLCYKKLRVENPWFSGTANISTYCLEELMGTKMRALYQRKKSRDLFDLAIALQFFPNLDTNRVIKAFNYYLDGQGLKISRAEFEKNLYEKLSDRIFTKDLSPLLNVELFNAGFSLVEAAEEVYNKLIKPLSSYPWKKVDKLLKMLTVIS